MSRILKIKDLFRCTFENLQSTRFEGLKTVPIKYTNFNQLKSDTYTISNTKYRQNLHKSQCSS